MSRSTRKRIVFAVVFLVVGLALGGYAARKHQLMTSATATYADADRRVNEGADSRERAQAMGERVSAARFVDGYTLERNVFGVAAAASLLVAALLARAARKSASTS